MSKFKRRGFTNEGRRARVFLYFLTSTVVIWFLRCSKSTVVSDNFNSALAKFLTKNRLNSDITIDLKKPAYLFKHIDRFNIGVFYHDVGPKPEADCAVTVYPTQSHINVLTTEKDR
jgi:hypothetical protein